LFSSFDALSTLLTATFQAFSAVIFESKLNQFCAFSASLLRMAGKSLLILLTGKAASHNLRFVPNIY